jgi:hypothetical protein
MSIPSFSRPAFTLQAPLKARATQTAHQRLGGSIQPAFNPQEAEQKLNKAIQASIALINKAWKNKKSRQGLGANATVNIISLLENFQVQYAIVEELYQKLASHNLSNETRQAYELLQTKRSEIAQSSPDLTKPQIKGS